MIASHWRLGRPPRFSAVDEPCREHCLALVQAFSVWRARIEHRWLPSGERKSKGITQTRSSTSSPCRLTIYPRAGGDGSRARGTPSSSKSSEKTCVKECFFMWTDNDINASNAAFTCLGAKRRNDQFWGTSESLKT